MSGPKVTQEHIESLIVSETYTVLPSGKVMICELILKNGFSVRGEAAVVSIVNFNFETGKTISRRNAVDKIWPLEGYLLQEKIFQGNT